MTVFIRSTVIAGSVLAIAALSSCGSGSPGDVEAPEVTGLFPADGALDIETGSRISVMFDEDMYATTVTANSFVLDSEFGRVTGAVNYDVAGRLAEFVPDKPLALLTDYTATISKTVTDLSGNALVDDVSWSFSTADGVWADEVRISIATPGEAYKPEIALDKDGNGIAVWLHEDSSGRTSVWGVRYVAGEGWMTPELLEEDDAGDALHLQLAVNAGGDAIAVWAQDDGNVYSILASRYIAGSGWEQPERVQYDQAANAFSPKVVIDSNGEAHAIWTQEDNGMLSVWASRLLGGVWMAATMIADDIDQTARPPVLAGDGYGNAMVIWIQIDSQTGMTAVWSRRYTGNRWQAAQQVSTGNFAGYPDVDMDRNSNAVAVWAESDINGEVSVRARRYAVGQWGDTAVIDSGSGASVGMVRVAADYNGNAVAVWVESDTSESRKVWASWLDGGVWREAVILSQPDVTGLYDPVAAVDHNGNALVLWHSESASGSAAIQFARYAAGSWSQAGSINNDAAGINQNIRVAVSPGGQAVAVWQKFKDSQGSIVVKHFE